MENNDKEEIESFIKKLLHSAKYDLTINDTKLRKQVKGEIVSAVNRIQKILDDE